MRRTIVIAVIGAALVGAASWFLADEWDGGEVRGERISLTPASSDASHDEDVADEQAAVVVKDAPAAAGEQTTEEDKATEGSTSGKDAAPSGDRIVAAVAAVAGKAPTVWGEHPAGVATRLAGDAREIALTLDACGGATADAAGNGYDADLIATLRREEVPATLFVNSRWIAAHPREFADLAADPLFEIANHGTAHVPCSVTGREAYGITGTDSPIAAAHEMDDNAQTITRLTGRMPRYFRPGTAYTDDVCVAIATRLGYTIAGYSLLGDAGATWDADRVTRALAGAQPGDIALLHMNRPAAGTAEGVAAAIPLLREKGFSFVRLSDRDVRTADQ